MPVTPSEEYDRRLEVRAQERAACDRRRFAIGNSRLIVVLAGAAIGYAAFALGSFSAWLVLLPLAVFFWLGGRLQTMEQTSTRLGRAVAFYSRSLERLGGRWPGSGATGARFIDERHVYASDLDLFGEGSLFQLLCQARTRMGEETLAAWLLAPAAPDTVSQRHEAVRELACALDLREDLAVLGEDAGAGVHAEELASWGEAPAMLRSASFRRIALGLSVVGGLSIVAALAYVGSLSIDAEFTPQFSAAARVYFFVVLLVFGTISWRFGRLAEPVFIGAEEAVRDVDLLAGVLERLEAESFSSRRLAFLRAELDTAGEPPSRRIARLHRLMDRVDQRDNMFVRLLGPLILWDVHLAYALEDWRRASGPAMRQWLNAVGEVEALSSLAAYHYERPEDVFPELVSAGSEPVFDAAAVCHPLLPSKEAVANDLVLGDGAAQMLVVSGSNMSGKSTLLRTVGVAAVLAQAGAPVTAVRLRLSPLAVGASIRVSDSLQEGESRFYAEILRLQRIVEIAARADRPALFLIDEFLHGTNSHDRRIGAEAIVRGLVDRGAIGLITTHDLALTQIADALGGRSGNVHFEDHLEGGRMRFDYRMRPGVVQKSNALELMRSVGLDV